MEKTKQQEELQAGTSGYVERLDAEMDTASQIQVQKFGHLQEFYVSDNGHTRLYYTSRYGKLYVLKCLKADFLYTPLYRQALAKEFEIGLQLDHPHICRTLGMENVEPLGPAIVMERIDGCTLKQLIEQGKLTRPLARKLAWQIADAVGYLHSKQIVHRDLKPTNIMVTYKGHDAKLVDFSLADSDAFNVLKQPAGTSGYIAPEQLLPDAKADLRADIYSLGRVMKDMAQATGDKRMARIAALCTRRNVDERPSDIGKLKRLAAQSRRQSHLVALLSVAAMLAGMCAAWAAYGRWLGDAHANSPVPDDGNAVDTHGTTRTDGNQAMEYDFWPTTPTP